MRSSIQRHALPIFFCLAFAIFWLATPLANALQFGLIASFTPSAVALLLTGLGGGASALWALVSRVGRWRVSWVWYAAALGIPLGASLAVLGASRLLGAAPLAEPAPTLRLFVIIYVLALGEELGWRGFVLPRLLARLPALPAALIMGAIHALYHLPLWFAPGFPTPSYSIASFAAASLAFGIVWTWLYLHTDGSVLIALLFHGTINAAGNLFFGGVPPAQLGWLMPIAFGLSALGVLVLARSDWVIYQK
jgi:membrane protease YdiL (CAAX protease family)